MNEFECAFALICLIAAILIGVQVFLYWGFRRADRKQEEELRRLWSDHG